jgi:hypothetical protein
MGFDATAWKETAEGRGAGEEAPPDDTYDAELVKSKIATRERDGAQWLVLRWRVISGRHRDDEWESMHTIDGYKPDGETNPGLAYTIESLALMGVTVAELNRLEDLEAAAEGLEGGAFAVQVKRSGSFTNTYPRRVLEQAAPSLPGSGGAYGQAPPAQSSTNAIYGGDAPTPAPRDERLVSQTTRDELSGRQPERTGVSDVPSNPDDFKHPEADPTANDDVPWDEPEQPPKRGDVNPDTGKPFEF